MRFHTSVLVLLTTITTVLASETASFSAQWQARVESDVDTVNADLDALTAFADSFNAKAIVRNIIQLTDDVHMATENVQAGSGVNDLAAMAIIFYVEEHMAPKVEEAMSALVKVKRQVSKAGKRKAVARGLRALDAETKKLGVVLLFKTPAEKQVDAGAVMVEIIDDVEKAVAAYS